MRQAVHTLATLAPRGQCTVSRQQLPNTPYVPGAPVVGPVTALRQVGADMPRGVQQRGASFSPSRGASCSPEVTHDDFRLASEAASAPGGRRVRQVAGAGCPYVEVECLSDAHKLAADITSHYDSMHAAVQRFTAKDYGGSTFALEIKDSTLEMLKRTMVSRLDNLIDPDAQLIREQKIVRKLKRQVRALQEEQEEQEEGGRRRSTRRSL